MGWGKVAEYIMAFLRWCWENKWTILGFILTIIFFIMMKYQSNVNDKLTKDIEVLKSNISKCETEKDIALNCNADLEGSLDLCKKELQISKDSFKEAESIKQQFDLEIEKYKQLAAAIDEETDPELALEKKKKLIEELFKGQNSTQINNTIKKIKNVKPIRINFPR